MMTLVSTWCNIEDISTISKISVLYQRYQYYIKDISTNHNLLVDSHAEHVTQVTQLNNDSSRDYTSMLT